MKRFVFVLTALLVMATSASAMSYQQARDQALFLTDKMAYELNLSDEQYEAAYEINLDYLMRIDNYDDLYGTYWRQRNLDLYYILSSWQYRAYCDASYFYRPLYWDGGFWHFGIYARYPYRDFFYFGCPDFVISYRGGHSWYHNGGRSWYRGRDWGGPGPDGPRPGMRDRFDRGNYGTGFRVDRNGSRSWGNGSAMANNQRNNNGTRTFGNMRSDNSNSPLRNRTFGNVSQSNVNPQSNSRSFGMPRESSTRTTVTRPDNSGFSGGGHFGNRGNSFGSNSGSTVTPRSTFTPRSNSGSTRSFSAPSAPSNSGSHSFGNRGSFGGGSSSFSGSSAGTRSSGGSTGGGFSGGGHFGRR
jgi:hypothetical protein